MNTNTTLAGTQVYFRGQRYLNLGTKPYTNHHGNTVSRTRWGSLCPHCGGLFTFTSNGRSLPPRPNRRCQKHKQPGRRVSKRLLTKHKQNSSMHRPMAVSSL